MSVGTGNGSTLATESLTTLHWFGIVLALVSGVIHLAIGIGSITNPLGVSFVLAGLGFFGAVALLLVDYRRRLLYAVGVPFVGVQIVLWLALNQQWSLALDTIDPSEAVDKVAQVVLVVILLVLYRRE